MSNASSANEVAESVRERVGEPLAEPWIRGSGAAAGVTLPQASQSPRTKVCLAGGHATTIKGIGPGDLAAEIERAKGSKIPLLFLQSEGTDDNGVCIDPASVVALIRV